MIERVAAAIAHGAGDDKGRVLDDDVDIVGLAVLGDLLLA